ncbi:MAG: cupin domain-containing protein [Candidatus Latescibacter sp.]|nr:cupin domain-containing protein [Candidatus Latescibacter sp.]
MSRPISILCLLLLTGYTVPAFAQNQLDPAPYDPAKEPNPDMYISSYKDSMPVHTHGALIERAVLTRCDGDPMNPPTKGAVLKYVNRFSYATLDASGSTSPTTLKNEQELFLILSGKGRVTAGKKTVELYPGMFFMVPCNLSFTITNTGDEEMTMYLVAEPTPPGFRPNTDLFVRDENVTPWTTSNAHWVNAYKDLIMPDDGLATLQMVLTVELYPMTFAQPHSHIPGCEEVWVTMSGEVYFLLGKQIRRLPVGSAYEIPPNDKVPHANFNVSEKPIKFFYFARFNDHEPRK